MVTRLTLGAVLLFCCSAVPGFWTTSIGFFHDLHCPLRGGSVERTGQRPFQRCVQVVPRSPPITSPGRPAQPHWRCDLCHPLVSSQRPEQITSLPPPPIHGPPTAAHLPPCLHHPHHLTSTHHNHNHNHNNIAACSDIDNRRPRPPLCRVTATATDTGPGPVCSHDVRAQTASAAAACRGKEEARARAPGAGPAPEDGRLHRHGVAHHAHVCAHPPALLGVPLVSVVGKLGKPSIAHPTNTPNQQEQVAAPRRARGPAREGRGRHHRGRRFHWPLRLPM